jgi:UDP-N-acetyl-D-mannosaminuronate dehydrogenase
MEYQVEEVHHIILIDAAEIANRMAAQEQGIEKAGIVPTEDRMSFVSGEIFRPDPGRSRKGGLCLSIDPFVFDAYPEPMQTRLREIGREAMKEALVKNQFQLVGLMLGEARQGRNYFDRFILENQQTRIF